MSDTAPPPVQADSARRSRKGNRLGVGGPRIDGYAGAWAITTDHANCLIGIANRLNIKVHLEKVEHDAADRISQYADSGDPTGAKASYGTERGETLVEGGIAIIEARGTLMKFVGSMSGGTSTVQLRRQVRRARTDTNVQKVLLVIDSPGGSVAGTQELAQDLADLAATKPLHVFADSLMASAALWIGTQAAVISAGPTALVGSIGGVMAVADFSKAAAKEGIKVHVITSDGAENFKGAGIEGSKVTTEQVAEWKRVLNGLCEHFFTAIAQGRGIALSKVKAMADGRIHLAADAQKMGLIDHVETIDAAMNRLRAAPVNGKQTRAMKVEAADVPENSLTAEAEADVPPAGSEAGTQQEIHVDPKTQSGAAAPQQVAAPATTEPKAASMAELIAACAGAPDSFLVAQAKASATVQGAKDAYMTHLAEENNKLQAKLKETAAAAAPAAEEKQPEKKTGGNRPIETKAAEQQTSAAGGTDIEADFETRVKAFTDAGMSRQKAAAKVFAADEPFRVAYIAARNAK